MQFINTIIAASILAFAAAAPTPSPEPQTTYYVPNGGNYIVPKTVSQYSVWTGAVKYNTNLGKIFKDGKTTDITTLATFDIPASLAGKTCSLHFYLDSTATLTGSGAFDVFTSQAPATQSTTTWPQGNLRDNHAGRMKAVIGGEATFLDGYPLHAKSFPCPAGYLVAGELVGTGDNINVAWDEFVAGAYISYA
ncbi:hypothetical protein BGZ60DRAFT_426704 [Tricladium varicosporioides]|nr:hypothetical protein BGZ60DRAFT_426704 [Hymenoscyphus varicosporioides]